MKYSASYKLHYWTQLEITNQVLYIFKVEPLL